MLYQAAIVGISATGTENSGRSELRLAAERCWMR